jgi:hypothetical protein
LRYKKVRIAVSLSVLLAIASMSVVFASSPSAFNQNDASASISWSASAYYPGDYGQVNITLISDYSQNLEINLIGIHFDWNNPNTYFFDALNSSVILPSYGNCTFSSLAFYVPPQENIGPHTYYTHFEGTEEGQTPQNVTWNSQTLTLQVYSENEVAYNQLLPQVMNKIIEDQKDNYRSPDAKSLLQNATEEYNQAMVFANQSQWQNATSFLQNASNLLDNATQKEQTFVAQQTLLEETGIAVIVIVVTLIVVIMVIKIRKQEAKANNPKQFT